MHGRGDTREIIVSWFIQVCKLGISLYPVEPLASKVSLVNPIQPPIAIPSILLSAAAAQSAAVPAAEYPFNQTE